MLGQASHVKFVESSTPNGSKDRIRQKGKEETLYRQSIATKSCSSVITWKAKCVTCKNIPIVPN